ncbi:MAG: hypothetical protein WAN65_17190 [Candidatus Sulfotelmatobacter sp.]
MLDATPVHLRKDAEIAALSAGEQSLLASTNGASNMRRTRHRSLFLQPVGANIPRRLISMVKLPMVRTTDPESFEQIVEWAYSTLPQEVTRDGFGRKFVWHNEYRRKQKATG